MMKISSSATFFLKWVFPLVFFGGTFAFFVSLFFGRALKGDPALLGFPVLMAAIGFIFMKKLVWGLMDEVFDCGDFLLVRNGGEEEEIPLSNVMNVNVTMLTNPPQITLRLITPGKWGDEVTFSPQVDFRPNPFAKCRVAEDLIVRAHQARTGQAG